MSSYLHLGGIIPHQLTVLTVWELFELANEDGEELLPLLFESQNEWRDLLFNSYFTENR
jgi:hypothetical protein